MLPLITCDPRQHLASGAYFNPNCFGTPTLGQLGTFNWPYIHAPGYFDTDLGIYKSFKVTESKSLQFRVQATNLLNHPLPQFGLAGNSDDTINLQQNTTSQIPGSAIAGGIGNCTGLPGGKVDSSNSGVCDVPVHSIATSNTNTVTTGKPAFKTGQRVLTFAVKFYF